MVLKEDNIGQTFLLPPDIRTMIPDNHVCFFIEKLVNCTDFSDIDFEFKDTPGQKAYPAAVLVRIIVLGMIYGIHSSRKLERIVRENIVFMYVAGFERPVFSTLASFKKNHKDVIEKIFLETINYGHNKDLIDLDSISLDGSKTRAYANKYNNLTEEDIQKLLYIIEKGILLDEEENNALEKREKKIMNAEDATKEQIKKALRESKNIPLKSKKKQLKTKKLQKEEKDKKGNDNKGNDNKGNDKNQKSLDSFRKKPMKESMRTNPEKYDDEMYELIDENNLNLCGKRILRQAIEKPETAYKQLNKLQKCLEMLEKTGDNTVNYTQSRSTKKSQQRTNHATRI